MKLNFKVAYTKEKNDFHLLKEVLSKGGFVKLALGGIAPPLLPIDCWVTHWKGLLVIVSPPSVPVLQSGMCINL